MLFRSKIEIENIRLSKSDDGSLLNNYIIISKQGVTDEFAGFYCIPALSDMFKSIPDEVDINMKLRTDLSEIHIININETYEIETDYDVYVPLVFEELHINYEEIIEDLQKDLGDISEYVTDMNVSVEMTIQNTIPCELTLKSEAQDINGKKLNIEVKFWDKDKIGRASCRERVSAPV